MIDLIYDNKAWDEIQKAVPEATSKDASDYIHTDRIQVTIPDESRDAYFKAAIRTGYCDVSFNFQMMIRQSGKHKAELDRWLQELKDEQENTVTKQEIDA